MASLLTSLLRCAGVKIASHHSFIFFTIYWFSQSYPFPQLQNTSRRFSLPSSFISCALVGCIGRITFVKYKPFTCKHQRLCHSVWPSCPLCRMACVQTASFVSGLPAESQQDTVQLIVHREHRSTRQGEWKGALLTLRIGISQLGAFVPLSTQTFSAKGQRNRKAGLVGGFASQTSEGAPKNILLSQK